jgi:hypothetical protein
VDCDVELFSLVVKGLTFRHHAICISFQVSSTSALGTNSFVAFCIEHRLRLGLLPFIDINLFVGKVSTINTITGNITNYYPSL